MNLKKVFAVGILSIGFFAITQSVGFANNELYLEMEEQIKSIEDGLQENTNFSQTFKRTTETYLKKRKIVIEDLTKQLSSNKMEIFNLKKENKKFKTELASLRTMIEAMQKKDIAFEKKLTGISKLKDPVKVQDSAGGPPAILAAIDDMKTANAKVDIEYIRKNVDDYKKFSLEEKIKKFVSDEKNSNLAKTEASFLLGKIYLAEKDYENASIQFSESFKRDDKSKWAADSMINIGLSLFNLGKQESACNAFSQVAGKQIVSTDDAVKRAEKLFKDNKCK